MRRETVVFKILSRKKVKVIESFSRGSEEDIGAIF